MAERAAAKRRDRPALVRRLTGLSTAPTLVVLVTLLCIAGLVMVGSASPVVSIITYNSPWTIFFRQALWMVVGVGALLLSPASTTGRGASGRSHWWSARSPCWSPSSCPGWG